MGNEIPESFLTSDVFATFFSCLVGWDGENGDGPCTGRWQLTFLAPSVLTRKNIRREVMDLTSVATPASEPKEIKVGGHQGQVGLMEGFVGAKKILRGF